MKQEFKWIKITRRTFTSRDFNYVQLSNFLKHQTVDEGITTEMVIKEIIGAKFRQQKFGRIEARSRRDNVSRAIYRLLKLQETYARKE